MVSYQIPHRSIQRSFCNWDPSECEDYLGFDPNIRNLPISILKVAKSSVGENAGRGLFASEMIPKGIGFGLNEQVQSFHLSTSSTGIVEMMYEEEYIDETDYDSLTTFFYGKNVILVVCFGWDILVANLMELLFESSSV